MSFQTTAACGRNFLLLLLAALLTSCYHQAAAPLSPGPLPPRRILQPAPLPPLQPASKNPDPVMPVILLDPGHGGVDNGAIGVKGTKEKDITLKIAYRLKQIIEKNLRSEVILTRYYDEFVPLNLRTALANRNRAAVFISIHVNASYKSTPSGIETFFLSMLASDKEAERVAAFENSVIKFESGDKRRYDDLQDILIDIFQTEIQKESSLLAESIHMAMTKKLRTRDRGVRQAPFYVLVGTQMPAVLVEVGFITNDREARKLQRADYQEAIARAIFSALLEFRQSLIKRAG